MMIINYILSLGGRTLMLSKILDLEPSSLMAFRSGIFIIREQISTVCATYPKAIDNSVGVDLVSIYDSASGR